MSVVPKYKGKKVYEIYPQVRDTDWDCIIIGSGMGGMSCGAALAKMGNRVLMLEQHYIPGGFTHSFARKGWHWDAGVHAIGEMSEGDIPRAFLDWLTDGKVEMVSLGNPYDRFLFHDGLVVEFADSRDAYIANMKGLFPEQSEGIDRYFETVEKAAKASMAFFGLKTMPASVDRIGSRIVSAVSRDWWSVTTAEILDECGIEGKLRTALTVHWGYYGSIPKESSFAVHALTHTHFWNGAYYPRGGSLVFAEQMLGQIVDAGGQVVCRASVDEVIVEDGAAVGVRMDDGAVINAPTVISAAGAKTTVWNLMPESVASSEWAMTIKGLKDSPSYICLNLGFEGDIREAGASSANLWLFENYDEEQKVWDISDPESEPHILYISFPSLKDPDYDPGKKVKHTGECVTFLDWDLFEKWANSGWPSRRRLPRTQADYRRSPARPASPSPAGPHGEARLLRAVHADHDARLHPREPGRNLWPRGDPRALHLQGAAHPHSGQKLLHDRHRRRLARRRRRDDQRYAHRRHDRAQALWSPDPPGTRYGRDSRVELDSSNLHSRPVKVTGAAELVHRPMLDEVVDADAGVGSGDLHLCAFAAVAPAVG